MNTPFYAILCARNCHNTTIQVEFVSGEFAVLMNDILRDYKLVPSDTHASLCFTHSDGAYGVKIKGTTVIPEFQSFLVLPLFVLATLPTTIVYRRKHCKSQNHLAKLSDSPSSFP